MRLTWSALGSISTTLLAHLPCCGPVLLVALGGASAGAGWLGALEKYRFWFIGASLVQLAIGFTIAYRRPHKCDKCADGEKDQVARFEIGLMWTVAALVAILTVTGFVIDPHR